MRGWSWVLVALSLFAATALEAEVKLVHAQDAPVAAASTQDSATEPLPGGVEAKIRARELLDEGLRRLSEVDHPGALAAFVEAHHLYPSPKLLINIGTTQRHLGRNADAAASYEDYLRHPEAEPARSAQLQRILQEIELVTGRVQIALSTHASLRLDGRLLAAPGGKATVRVDPGEHTLVAQAHGRPPTVHIVEVEAGGVVAVELIIPEDIDESPRFVVVKDTSWIRPVVGGSLLGLGGLGIAQGILFGVLAGHANREAALHCSQSEVAVCDARGSALGVEVETRAMVSTVSFVAGGVFAAAGATVLLVDLVAGAEQAESVDVSLGSVTTLTVRW